MSHRSMWGGPVILNLGGRVPHGSIYHAAISPGMSGAVGWLHEMVANQLTPDVMAYTAPRLLFRADFGEENWKFCTAMVMAT